MMFSKMRERITILRVEKADDGYGGYNTNWQDYMTVWAAVKMISGTELFRVGARLTVKRIECTIRYRDVIDETMKVRWRGELYNILSIIPDERRNYMTLQCEKAVGENE